MADYQNSLTKTSETQKGSNGAANVVTVPFDARAITLAIAGTSTSSASQALPAQGNILRMVNEGPNNCYVAITHNGVSATATLPVTSSPVNTCTPIMAGEDISLTIPNYEILNIAIICRAAATCTLLVSVGEGV